MFANIRMFSIIIALAILLLSILGGHYIKKYSTQHLVVDPIVIMSEELSKLYTIKVWDRYSAVIKYLHGTAEAEWQSVSTFHNFTEISKEFLTAKNIVKTRILSSKNQVLFDNNSQLILNNLELTTDQVFENVKKLKKGETSNIITYQLISDGKKTFRKYILCIYSPLILKTDQDEEDIKSLDMNNTSILEFHVDIDEAYTSILRFQYMITVVLALIAGLVIGLIIFVSKKVEELIDKQQEVALELANAKAVAETESRAKSQFLANVSHELRTPLNAIIGFSEIINSEAMGSLNNEKYKEFIQDIHASGVHLLSLINDILDFSKSDENKLQIDFEPIDLTKIVKISLRMVLPRAETAKVQLVDEVPAEHLIIQADPKRTKQVILNLLSNAVKFTPEGGQVTIKIWKDTQLKLVIVEIKDSGVGMAAQDLAKALSPFGQVENSLSKRFEGTGLGLPLTKKLVELMNGKFDIQSEPGLGTTIVISFPFKDEEIQTNTSPINNKPTI